MESKIFGPHFEALAGQRTARYASAEAGLAVGPAGQTVIACRERKTGHEIDVLALARGSSPRTPARRSRSPARPSTATAAQARPGCAGFSTSATC